MKKDNKNVVSNIAQRKAEKKEMSQSPSKNDLLKATMFQRHSNYYDFAKTGFRNIANGLYFRFGFWAPLGRFVVPFWRPLDFEGVPISIIF